MRAVDVIEKKRDAFELQPDEIKFLVDGYVAGEVADYQMSAFTMAVCCRGMSDAEIVALTQAMIDSGSRIDFTGLGAPAVDKHSTGGVGDKVTLVVCPVAAALGVMTPLFSGRGLGHTGGTLDKLESFPGYRSYMEIGEVLDIARRTGVVVVGTTPDIVPADRKIYALRDASGTVVSAPLIAASIMSKKLAVQTDALVLEIKVGEGAFFRDLAQAREFARIAMALGRGFNRRMCCVLTAMDAPLGRTIGNSLEVEEAVATLQGGGPADFNTVCEQIAARMVIAGGVCANMDDAAVAVQRVIADGSALRKMQEWIEAQGGDFSIVQRGFPKAAQQLEVVAPQSGYITAIHSLALGRLSMQLGAGRVRQEDEVDHAAGIVTHVGVGDKIEAGRPLATLHTNLNSETTAWIKTAQDAFVTAPSPVTVPNPIIEIVE